MEQGLRVVVIMDAIRHNPLDARVLEEAIKAVGTLALDSTHQKVNSLSDACLSR